jgi:hypothetical protein
LRFLGCALVGRRVPDAFFAGAVVDAAGLTLSSSVATCTAVVAGAGAPAVRPPRFGFCGFTPGLGASAFAS